MNQKYSDCLKEMYSLRRFGIKLGLSTIKSILSQLNDPQKKFKSIHIAGTNGKGSVGSTIASILIQAGFKTGLYTSPHLIKFNERICINNNIITDDRVVYLHNIVKKINNVDRELTFFEYTTAMAFYEFASQKVDWAVIETGMGGRLDATNVIKPEISIITNISLEHKQYLGNTISKIAFEKAGIIKKNVPVITDTNQKSALKVIENISKNNLTNVYKLGNQIKIRCLNNSNFNYYGINKTWKDLKPILNGNHQYRNAGLALAACDLLDNKNKIFSEDIIKKGLLNVKWPGRLEIVSQNPILILDGAHNIAAIKMLCKFLKDKYSDKNITLVVGVLDDKPYKEIFRELLPVGKRLILTCPKIDRAIDVNLLYDAAKTVITDVKIIPEVSEALNYALKNSSLSDIICVTGSLYVIGEAKSELLQCKDQLFLA